MDSVNQTSKSRDLYTVPSPAIICPKGGAYPTSDKKVKIEPEISITFGCFKYGEWFVDQSEVLYYPGQRYMPVSCSNNNSSIVIVVVVVRVVVVVVVIATLKTCMKSPSDERAYQRRL